MSVAPARLVLPPSASRPPLQVLRTGLLLASIEYALLKHQLDGHSRRDLCSATRGKVDVKQLDAAARVVSKHTATDTPQQTLSATAHFAAQLCEEMLKANKASKGPGPGRDALWTKAAIAAAEHAVANGYGRDQPPLTLAAALTFLIFERHTPKTAPSAKQVADAAGISEADLMTAYCEDVLTYMEVRRACCRRMKAVGARTWG